MRILIGHHLWARPGGGEQFAAYTAKILRELGHEVALASTSGIDFEKLKTWFNVDLSGCKTYTVVKWYLPYFGIYQRLLFWRAVKKGIVDFKPDIVIVDNEIYKPILKLRSRYNFRLVEYIHFPFDAVVLYLGMKRNIPEDLRQAFASYYGRDIEEYYSKYFSTWYWKLYFKVWLRLYSRWARGNPFEVADKVLCNSRYIARIVREIWGSEPEVLHPPVDVELFSKCAGKSFEERENKVVMLGRISQEKKIEWAIEAVARTSTKPRLVVIGGLTKAHIPYKQRLEKLARDLGVDLRLYIDAPRELALQEVATAKVFVHTCVGEHFGIAVVEAMAAGLPVIVHKSGGPWLDIVEEGKYGLGFETVDDLAEKIDKLMTDEKTWRYYSEAGRRRAQEFGLDRYREKLRVLIEKLS